MKRLAFLILLLLSSTGVFASQEDSALLSLHHTDSLCHDSLLQAWSERYQLYAGMIENPRVIHLFEDWKGTPYRYGGNSRKGIDCSGFVSMVYDSVYRVTLLGGSADIFRKMTPVDRDELREGDLVFFRIRKKRISHVGLYLSNNKFIHATTRGGVMISDLNEPYYRRYYFRSGRLPQDGQPE